jgi:general secretion pathway protein L
MTTDPVFDAPSLNTTSVVRIILLNWLSELKAVFGPTLLPQANACVVFDRGDRFEIKAAAPEDAPLLGSVSRSGEPQKEIRELRATVDRCGAGHDVLLCLPQNIVVRPRASLPKTTRQSLLGALGYELERLSPIPVSELYYDYVVTGRSGTLLDIEIRAVRKDAFDETASLLRAAGLRLCGVKFDGDAVPGDWQQFPVDRSAVLQRQVYRFRRMGLLGLASILALAALAGAYSREMTYSDAAIEANAETGIRAARVEKLQHAIASAGKDLSYAAEQKRGPLAVAILSDLTQVLPDGTWVSEITIDGPTVRIVGSSSSASDLIGLIDRSPHFGNARFEAPLIHDQTTGVDRFNLAFQVRGQ